MVYQIDMTKKIWIPVAVIGAVALWTILKSLKTPRKRFKVRRREERQIHIINTHEEWEKIYPSLIEDCTVIKAVGFDCEWVFDGKRHPVALLQIATHTGLCLLVRLCQMTSVPLTLKNFLSNKSILKVGVSAKDDGRKLYKDYGMAVNGCVDLRYVLRRVRGIPCPEHQGLQSLAESILGVTMKKEFHIRCGNWEAEVLSPEQIDYAADDAVVAVDIFVMLVIAKVYGPKSCYRNYGIELSQDETSFWYNARNMCQGIVDVQFKSTKNVTRSLLHNSTKENTEDEDSSVSLESKKCEQPKVIRAYTCRQRPLYYNCRLLAPDDVLLTTCDVRKAEWYMDKGLAEKVSDNPLTVRLKFEPAGRPQSENDYYLQEKDNVCVVCGASDSYIRKLVVPKEYRRYFPKDLKDHSSHDVLLMCLPCHQRSADHDALMRQTLAQECNAPLDCGSPSSVQDHDLQKVRSAAKALLANQSTKKIPEKRVQELEECVKNFYGIQNLSDDILKKALELNCRVVSIDDYKPSHGKRVVIHMKETVGLLEFEKRWRQHFVDTMQPKFLPSMWSVDHKPERMTITLPRDGKKDKPYVLSKGRIK